MNSNGLLAEIVAGDIPVVSIVAFIKNPHHKNPRALYMIKDKHNRVLGIEKTQSQAIFKVEQEGWIFQPD